jgi:hypothetical protein
MFQRNIPPPSSGLQSKPSKEINMKRQQTELVSYLAYSVTLKMEAVYSSDTMMGF